MLAEIIVLIHANRITREEGRRRLLEAQKREREELGSASDVSTEERVKLH